VTQSSRADHQSHSGRNRRTPADYFVAGGTLSDDVPSYVERPADDELFELILSGKFCYVLTTRQMGKSSLMIRTARRLQAAGMRTAIIDLTTIGSNSAETWYLDLIVELVDELDLAEDAEAWWQARASQGPVRRFSNFLRDVVLTEIQAPAVIFFDEIDATLGLPFSDDFFTTIRALYNARAKDPIFNRLTFTLIGVASPSDLIMDRTRTPFNIGEGISLNDFGRDRANVLQAGLEAVYPAQGEHIFNRIYDWTGGHPYLTQKLCQKVVKTGHAHWTEARVDALVDQLFLSEQAHREKNLQFVRDKILTHARHRQLLGVYRKIYEGERVSDDERFVIHNQLKLSGLVKAENGQLQVRNDIYRHVFDGNWIEANTQRDWNRIITWLAVAMMVLVVALTGTIFWYYSIWVPGLARQATLNFYQAADDPEVQLDSLATLFELRGLFGTADYGNDARQLFFALESADAQANLLEVKKPQLISVIRGLSMTLADVDDSHRSDWLLNRMLQALEELQPTDEVEQLKSELDHWRQGRQLARAGRFEEALVEYDRANEALDPSRDNPALRFERIKVLIALEDFQQALSDLDQIMAGRSAEPTPTVTSSGRTAVATTVTAPLTPTTVITEATIVPASPTLASDTSSTPAQAAEATNPTPSATPHGTPTPTPTPAPVKLASEFATTGQIVVVVRQLINSNPGLLEVLLNAQSSEYSNLREFGLVPTPPSTPTATTTVSPLVDNFRNTTSANDRIISLASLFDQPGFGDQARQLFFNELTPEERLALFETADPAQVGPQLTTVVRGLYANLENNERDNILLRAMADPLDQIDDVRAGNLATEIKQWLAGREMQQSGEYEQAVGVYGAVIAQNDQNPGTFFDRGLAYTTLGEADSALTDFEEVLTLDESRQSRIQQIITGDPNLYAALTAEPSSYRVLAAIISTPTSTPTSTSTPIQTLTPSLTPVKLTTTTAVIAAASTDTPTPTPTPTPRPATVIFVQSSGVNHDLGLVSSGGALIDADLHPRAAAPAWSPNGGEVAFYGEEGIQELGGIYAQGNGVWILNVQSGSPRLLFPIDHVRNMTWSPDGDKLAFEIGAPGVEIHSVVVIDARDGKEINRFPGEQPAWLPDSAELVIKSCAPECGLWRVGIDGSSSRLLTRDSTDSYPAISPNGEYLVFSSRFRNGDWEVYRVPLANPDAELVRLTNRPGTDTTPVISPDGREIYIRTDAFGGWQITAMAIDGSNERTIRSDVGPSDDWGLARPAVN
jgi:Tol biopolymer transport system component